jgi:hypothetical protein
MSWDSIRVNSGVVLTEGMASASERHFECMVGWGVIKRLNVEHLVSLPPLWYSGLFWTAVLTAAVKMQSCWTWLRGCGRCAQRRACVGQPPLEARGSQASSKRHRVWGEPRDGASALRQMNHRTTVEGRFRVMGTAKENPRNCPRCSRLGIKFIREPAVSTSISTEAGLSDSWRSTGSLNVLHRDYSHAFGWFGMRLLVTIFRKIPKDEDLIAVLLIWSEQLVYLSTRKAVATWDLLCLVTKRMIKHSINKIVAWFFGTCRHFEELDMEVVGNWGSGGRVREDLERNDMEIQVVILYSNIRSK